MPDADFPAIDYNLNIHDGAVATAFHLHDSGVRLVGNYIEWRIGDDARRAALSDIRAIRLTTEVETARGPTGATSCQIRFSGGGAVTVFGGNSSSPDVADRRARYEAFVTELHRRLRPDDRARISFVAGYSSARFYALLVAAVFSVLLLAAAALATLLGLAPRQIGTAIGLSIGAALTVGLFRLLQLNAPHIYDPSNPIASAEAGSIADTLGQAIRKIRRGMTVRKGMTAAGIGGAAIMIVVVIVASHQRVGLFESSRARSAFDAILARTGPDPTVTYVAATSNELLVETPEDRDSTSRIDWRASRRTLFGLSEWDDVSGPTVRYPMSMSEDLGDQPFILERNDTAHLDHMIKAAIARAALGPGSTMTQMTLTSSQAFAGPDPEARWTIEVDGPQGHAELYAHRTGTLFPPTPRPVGLSRIVISAVARNSLGFFPINSGTWIRIVNPDQSVRFDQTLKPGDSYRVPDVPGLRLQTGIPGSLSITVDGRAARLPPAGYAGRLDTVLDPRSLLAGADARK